MSAPAEVACVLTAPTVGLPDSPQWVARNSRGDRVSVEKLSAQESFSHLAASGAGYLAVRYGLGVLVSLGNMLVLTWWIGPHAYGLFVTAIGLVAFLASLGRAGVDTYLVRREAAPDARIYDIAGTLILMVSVGLVLAGAGLAPLLMRWYGSREFVAPYLVLLCNLPIVGLTGVPTAKLERELNFRTVAGIELAGQTVGLVFSLALAWSGMGVWAPVAGQAAWQVFLLIAAYSAARLLPRLRFGWTEAREMLSFGIGVTASMRAWQLRTLVNPLLVGRFAGAEGVAFVGLAIRIAEALGSVRLAAGRLAVAALARLRDQREEFRSALQRALLLQVMTLGPLLCLFALLGPLVVRHVIGIRWMPSLAVYPFIAAGVLVNSIYNLQASALFVIGRQWLVMRSYLAHVVLLGAGTLWLLPRFGIAGYGWAELLACVAYFMIQAGLARTAAIAYRKLVPWLAIFLALVFVPMVNRGWAAALWVPLLGSAAVWGWKQAPFAGSLRRACERASSRRLHHLLTFAAKTRQRGWPYVHAVATYSLRSRVYRSQLRLRHVRTVVRNWWRSTASRHPSLSRTRYQGDRLTPVFHFSGVDIPRIILSIPGSLRRKAVAEADAVMEHRFTFRGWEQRFPALVDWDACPNGNASWRWDLNRHPFFLTLATSYYYTRDATYLRKLVELWADWIERNPPGRGEAWKHPFEVAARLQNWIWAYFLLLCSDQVTDASLEKFATALREHGTFLNFNLEYHWPNNHLLLEAKALYEYALLFPQFSETTSYRVRARRVLEREVMRQVLVDGAHSELCSMYHRILASELGELALLCQRNRAPLAPAVEQRVGSLMEFSRALLREDGSMPLLGDSAMEDVQIRFDLARQDYSHLNYWLRQPEPPATRAEGSGRAPELQIFPEAGYAFVRGGEGQERFHLTFDFGRFSRCAAANHAHCDALSFELYARGRPLLIDPGAYLPWGDGERWARYFRSTSAHNTLVVDGKEQSELCVYADVQQEARTQLLGYSVAGEAASVSAECTPYWAAVEGISHRREICCDAAGTLHIRDQVRGSGRHHLAWSFHFAPSIEVDEADAGILVGKLKNEEAGFFILKVLASHQPDLALAYGETDSLRGWAALHSSEVVPAYTAVYAMDAVLPFEIEFHVELTGDERREDTVTVLEELPVTPVCESTPSPA